MNLYAYCVNNPLSFVDPFGLVWEDPNLKIVLYDGSEKRKDGITGFFDEALDDDYWDVKIDISGMKIHEFLNTLRNLKGHIMDQMKAVGKEFGWDQITIEGLWIFDHGGNYGDAKYSRGSRGFDLIWSEMGKALDENHGMGAVIHHRGCDMATDYGDKYGSDIKHGAIKSGHSVTGSDGSIWWFERGRKDLPDYYSDVGYKMATPNGPRGSATDAKVSNYYQSYWHTNWVDGDMVRWISKTIVW